MNYSYKINTAHSDGIAIISEECLVYQLFFVTVQFCNVLRNIFQNIKKYYIKKM